MSTHLLTHLRGRVDDRPTLFARGVRLASGILLAALVACGGDSTGPETIAGTYALQTIDGRALPVVVAQDADEKDEITAGGITLSKGTAFTVTVTVTVRVTIGTQVSTETSTLTGTWSRSGETVTLNTSDGESTSAALSGRTLTLMGDAGVAGVAAWVFRK